ncbi:MAG: hypothetical protein WB984_07845, partial [Thermoplasmata archaeon]
PAALPPPPPVLPPPPTQARPTGPSIGNELSPMLELVNGRPILPSRPLTLEEHTQLVRLLHSPAAAGARGIGILAAAGSAILGFSWFLGFSYDPTSFLIVVLALMIVGLVASGAARQIVRPPRDALRYGRAVEVNGIALPTPTPAGKMPAIQVGPVVFTLHPSLAAMLQSGAMHRVVVALGVPPGILPGVGPLPRGLLLQINGYHMLRPPSAALRW